LLRDLALDPFYLGDSDVSLTPATTDIGRANQPTGAHRRAAPNPREQCLVHWAVPLGRQGVENLVRSVGNDDKVS
jgi:hypothetical protein